MKTKLEANKTQRPTGVALRRLVRLTKFANSLLNPEQNGYAVSENIRDQARVALGMKPVECREGKPLDTEIVCLDKALSFLVNNIEEIKNQIGGVIGYRLQLNAEETEQQWRILDRSPNV